MKHSTELSLQIEFFIEFVDNIAKDPTLIGLTEENKNELRKAFDGLIKTAQTEIIKKIALNLTELNEKINEK